jgi:hypothetical protein
MITPGSTCFKQVHPERMDHNDEIFGPQVIEKRPGGIICLCRKFITDMENIIIFIVRKTPGHVKGNVYIFSGSLVM